MEGLLLEDVRDVIVAAAPGVAYVASKLVDSEPTCEDRLMVNTCGTLAVGGLSLYLLARGVYLSRESSCMTLSMIALACIFISRPFVARKMPEERRADTAALALALLCVGFCLQCINSSKRVYAVPAATWLIVLLARC